jgi:ribosomal protein S18 acetylase RimI-like enzyme
MLLTHVIESAAGRQLSLTTRSDNPARRLYERHGFVVRNERTHHAFERRTGSPGRILMVRPATAQGALGSAASIPGDAQGVSRR